VFRAVRCFGLIIASVNDSLCLSFPSSLLLRYSAHVILTGAAAEMTVVRQLRFSVVCEMIFFFGILAIYAF